MSKLTDKEIKRLKELLDCNSIEYRDLLGFIDDSDLIAEIRYRQLNYEFEITKEIDEFSDDDIEDAYFGRNLEKDDILGKLYIHMIEGDNLDLLFDKISYVYPYTKRILDKYEIVLKK